MKRIILTFAFFLSTVVGVFAQNNNAVYVYRNDGEFNAFRKQDVLKMEVSHYDVNDNYHQDVQMQIIYTPDSVYKIPLAVIDSVSFVSPEAKLNSMVFPLEGKHDPYITKAETLSFVFLLSTPSEYLPSKGNIVVSSYDCQSFVDGIIGKVESISKTAEGYEYTCSQATLDDIYDQIVYFGEIGNDMIRPSKSKGVSSLVSGTEASLTKILWDAEFSHTLSYSGTTTNINAADKAYMKATIRKTLTMPLYVNIVVENIADAKFDFNANCAASVAPDRVQLGNTINCPRIVIPEFPLIWFVPQLRLFGYIEEQGEINLDFAAHFTRSDRVDMIYSNGAWNFYYAPKTSGGIDVAEVSMKGYAEVGLQPEIMISLNGFPTGIGLNGKIGLKESIDFKFDALKYFDTGMYDALKDSKAYTTVPQSFSVFAQAGLFERSATKGELQLNSREPSLGTDKYLLPLFSEIKTEKQNDSSFSMTTTVSRDLLLPVSVGYSISDENNNLVYTSYSSTTHYRGSQTLTDVYGGKGTTIFPMVKFGNVELTATPKAKLNTGLPKISAFKQMQSSYSKKAEFVNNGVNYKLQYYVSVTVEIESIDGIEDWGYVCKDTDGNVERISLMKFGNSHTDYHFIYSNVLATSVFLYGYVKYEGEADYIYDTPNEYALKYKEGFPSLREYLIKLYNSTNGDNWTHNDNWCTELPLEEWYGFNKFLGFFHLDLKNNNLTGTIDLSGCDTFLFNSLDCSDNNITSIDISNSFLMSLTCRNNKICKLNVSGCDYFDSLDCDNNMLESIDVSSCSLLKYLQCRNNQLTNLGISTNHTKLYDLKCGGNKLTNIVIAALPALRYLSCNDNQLTSLDVSNSPELYDINCDNNPLTQIVASNCKKLYELSCNYCQLKSINISGCTEIESLQMNSSITTIEEFYASNCKKLRLYGVERMSQLRYLNVSGCTNWRSDDNFHNLFCDNIISLNVSGMNIKSLWTFNPQLRYLNVSGCVWLEDLVCHGGKLASLNASDCTRLNSILCDNNELTELDITGCKVINKLQCHNNHLNQVISGPFAQIEHFNHDEKYKYFYDKYGNPTYYTTNEYGWWYPGEPEKWQHTPN